jgi:hypothetical protein
MHDTKLSSAVRSTLSRAAGMLGTVDPGRYIGRAIDEAFDLPIGDSRYRHNTLSPGAAPLEPSFSEVEPYGLRFTMEPLGPGASAGMKRQEVSRQMRHVVGPMFGSGALYWFDRMSEDFRGPVGGAGLRFGGWYGAAFDRDGIYNSRAYYEVREAQLDDLQRPLRDHVQRAREAFPRMRPLFLMLSVRQRAGRQKISFRVMGPLRVEDLRPLLAALGLENRMAQLTRLFGLALGGLFEAPDGAVLIGISDGPDGPELEIELLIAAIAEVPDSFVELLRLGLAERPRHLRALDHWMGAFTPPGEHLPGDFSVLSISLTQSAPAQVSLYLRPMGFEIADQLM